MNKLFTAFFFFSSMGVFAQIPDGYYDGIEGKTGEELKTTLHNIIDNHSQLDYSQVWSALKYTDQDPENEENVILLYTGWSYPKDHTDDGGSDNTRWNREHTWAKSLGNFGTEPGAGTDLHHLRPAEKTVNSARSNYRFLAGGTEFVDNSRYGGGDGATGCNYSESNYTWEPADDVKGDVARMLFYMATRYEEIDGVDLELRETNKNYGTHGDLASLLEWHTADPVDDWEIRRNNRVYEKQGNRNPFIDHPELVAQIYDYTDGEIGNIIEPSTDVLLDISFDDGNEGCQVVQVAGETGWNVLEEYGKTYAKVETYGDGANESWLLTPSVDLSSVSNATMSFYVTSYNSEKKIGECGEGQFEVYYSTSFDGSSINKDDWTRFSSVDDVLLGERWTFVLTSLDLSGINGKTVYFAFAHRCDDSNGTTWEVDNVIVKGNTSVDNFNPEIIELKLMPNPTSNYFKLNQQADQVSVITMDGQVMMVENNIKPNTAIDISEIQNGIYLVQVQYDGKTAIQKMIIE